MATGSPEGLIRSRGRDCGPASGKGGGKSSVDWSLDSITRFAFLAPGTSQFIKTDDPAAYIGAMRRHLVRRIKPSSPPPTTQTMMQWVNEENERLGITPENSGVLLPGADFQTGVSLLIDRFTRTDGPALARALDAMGFKLSLTFPGDAPARAKIGYVDVGGGHDLPLHDLYFGESLVAGFSGPAPLPLEWQVSLTAQHIQVLADCWADSKRRLGSTSSSPDTSAIPQVEPGEENADSFPKEPAPSENPSSNADPKDHTTKTRPHNRREATLRVCVPTRSAPVDGRIHLQRRALHGSQEDHRAST